MHKDIAKYLGNSVFSRYEIAEHVPATFFGADENCMSIDFLLKENGVPILAFAILRTAYRRRSHQTIAGTIDACRKSDIKYTDVFVGLPNTEFYVIRKILKEIQ